MFSRVFAVLFLFALVPLSFGATKPWPSDATVLCYHVVESPADTVFTISREVFDQQMEYLSTAGFNVVPLAHVHEYVEGKRKSLPENPVVITIDDGWRCTYTEFYPILKKYGFPFTAFIYPKIIGQTSYALNWDQIEEMADDGVDIQSHSLSHPFLTRRRHSSMGGSHYQAWLQGELSESRRMLEKKTGKEVKFLAYPYGDYDSMVAAASKKAGYDAALTCDFGEVRKGSDPFRMKRAVVYEKTTFAEFRRLLGSRPLELEETTPAAGKAFDESNPVISAKIANASRLEPSSIGLTVLGRSVAPTHYDPETGSISLIVRDDLTGSRQQVVVWGRDRETGDRVEAVWYFYSSGADLARAQDEKRRRDLKRESDARKAARPVPPEAILPAGAAPAVILSEPPLRKSLPLKTDLPRPTDRRKR